MLPYQTDNAFVYVLIVPVCSVFDDVLLAAGWQLLSQETQVERDQVQEDPLYPQDQGHRK